MIAVSLLLAKRKDNSLLKKFCYLRQYLVLLNISQQSQKDYHSMQTSFGLADFRPERTRVRQPAEEAMPGV
jgi:hypothetical protein